MSGAYPDRCSRTGRAPRVQPLCTVHDAPGNLEPEELRPPGRSCRRPGGPASLRGEARHARCHRRRPPPDVLAIQEVLDPNALDDLIDRLDGSWRTALADPDGRGIHVGILSRAALETLEQIRDSPAGLLPFRPTMTAPPSTNSAGQACESGSAPAAGRAPLCWTRQRHWSRASPAKRDI